MRWTTLIVAAAVGLAGCAANPKQTVGELSRADPKYKSRACVQARREAARYEDHKDGRIALALAGNLVVPFAGTAASAAIGAIKEDRKKDLNHKVRAACTSDPLAKRRTRVARR
jgi:hypothetical protein